MTTVILANGSYPEHDIPVKHLSEAEMIVCCDGAAVKLVAHGLEPGIIIGDLDSVPPYLKEKYSRILVYDPDQETNDLTKAVNWCIKQGFAEVNIVGATGIREDHTLGNISLLTDYSKRIRVTMLTDHGMFRVFDHSVTIQSHTGQQVSLFSIDPTLRVTAAGLRYPLDNLSLSSWWRGTLNEAAGSSFDLVIGSGQIIVFTEY